MFIPLVFFVNIQANCLNIIDAKLYPYSIQRKHFIRDKKCFNDSGASILKNIETNETLELDGVVSGIQRLTNVNLLLINTYGGRDNKYTLNFFIIENNSSLSSIKGGIIGSGYAKPSIIIDLYNNEIIVINQEYIRENNTLGIRKIKYQYIKKLKKFKKLEDEKMFPAK